MAVFSGKSLIESASLSQTTRTSAEMSAEMKGKYLWPGPNVTPQCKLFSVFVSPFNVAFNCRNLYLIKMHGNIISKEYTKIWNDLVANSLQTVEVGQHFII